MAACARTPSALMCLRVNHLINGLHKQISCKNCLYAVNSYFTIYSYMLCIFIIIINSSTQVDVIYLNLQKLLTQYHMGSCSRDYAYLTSPEIYRCELNVICLITGREFA